ncbi:MAG TPA: glycosyltransferase [Ideonella sp.]|nr:glycosyltransferase [Ideonella sp.]
MAAPSVAAAAAGLPRVYLCGPIEATGEAARGGYQACNARSIDALRRAGVDVVPLPYPHPRSRGWRKQVDYVTGFLRLYGRLARCEPGSIVHLTALTVHFVYNEWPLLQIARWRGCRLVYDLRAGTKQPQYESRSALYRAVFRSSLRAAHEVMVEGEAVIAFIESLGRAAPVYFPNHLDTDALPWRPTDAALPAAPTVAYVGRIVPAKGVERLLEAAQLLRARGLAVQVLIAGDGERAYLEKLRSRGDGLDVRWLGPLSSRAVLGLWRRAHFFVFPTCHFGEGQSNALTEAMACGCVPVASHHGFNAAVIGEPRLVLPLDATADDYADAVQRLWPAAWPALSQAMQRRARERFSTAAALRTLLAVYRRAARLAPALRPAAAQGGEELPARQ